MFLTFSIIDKEDIVITPWDINGCCYDIIRCISYFSIGQENRLNVEIYEFITNKKCLFEAYFNYKGDSQDLRYSSNKVDFHNRLH